MICLLDMLDPIGYLMHHLTNKYLLTTLLLLLAACSTTPPPVKTPSVSDRFQEVAEQRVAAGDYEGAVDYYLRAAAVAPTRNARVSCCRRPVV